MGEASQCWTGQSQVELVPSGTLLTRILCRSTRDVTGHGRRVDSHLGRPLRLPPAAACGIAPPNRLVVLSLVEMALPISLYRFVRALVTQE